MEDSPKPYPYRHAADRTHDLTHDLKSRVPAKSARDPRLDFFRGLGMFIIFIAHVPGNAWTLWIPARFGFSDATEIFVFCSGMASAFAFGKAFERRGWWVGTARSLYRAWQIYWVHIGLFLALAGGLAALDAHGAFGTEHVQRLNLERFYADPKTNIIGLLTLTYVPNYFDILPMYFVILLLMPLVVGARALIWWGPFALVASLWIGAQLEVLRLPAEPWSDREWFFNPFGWQLVFFTGFALISGWIKPPPVTRVLIIAAMVIVLATVPFAYFRILREVELLQTVAGFIRPLTAKTDFGLLRYIHFLSLAYLAWVAAGTRGVRLLPSGPMRHVVAVIYKVGQQALATFVTGMFLARFMPVIFEAFGRSAATVLLVNLTGFAALIAVAYAVGWLKTERQVKAMPQPTSANAPVRSDVSPPRARSAG